MGFKAVEVSGKGFAVNGFNHSAIYIRSKHDILLILARNEAFAAVIVPYGLINAAFSLDICSIEDGRIPLSFVTYSATSRTKIYLFSYLSYFSEVFSWLKSYFVSL